MKRNYLLALLPILALTGCNGASQSMRANYVVKMENGLPTVCALGGGDHVTYLMMSRYGYLDIESVETHGVDVPEKFYENCIVWNSSSNGLLPTKEQVKSSVYGATFRGWAQYNDNIYPDYLTTVPATSGQTVYAIFDGTDAGGSGGGGGGGGEVTAYDVTFSVNLSLFDGWEGIGNFSVYAWGQNAEEPLGNWDACAGNLTGTGNTRTVTATNVTCRIVGAIFYFDQTGGSTPGRKQTTNMTVSISEAGTYNIAPTGSEITWDSDGKMTNFTITKAS